MRTWTITNTCVVMALALLQWGCFMPETKVIQVSPCDSWKEVSVSEDTMKIDADVKAYLRDQFSIKSTNYYLVPGGIPWVAISKTARNEMSEKSIERKDYKWDRPGYECVDVYPQGSNGAGFALAMQVDAKTSDEKIVGFYVLGAPATAK